MQLTMVEKRDFLDLVGIDIFAEDADGVFDDAELEVSSGKRLVLVVQRRFDVGEREAVSSELLA